MNWRREQTGWVIHSKGVPWHRVPLPTSAMRRRWYRFTHGCSAHSMSVHGREVTHRCICGAVRFGDTGPLRTPWSPAQNIAVNVKMGAWHDRNSRFHGTAMHYRPYIHALEEQP